MEMGHVPKILEKKTLNSYMYCVYFILCNHDRYEINTEYYTDRGPPNVCDKFLV